MNKEYLLQKYPQHKELIEKSFVEYEKQKLTNDCKCINSKMMAGLLDILGEKPADGNSDVMNMMQIQGANSPRPPCEDCFKEHVAKAIHNLNESLIGDGHPKFRWLAIGNLAEASYEIYGINPELAAEVRTVKRQMIADKNFIPDLMKYL